MNHKLEHLIALLQFDRFAPLYWGWWAFYAGVLVLLVLVTWLFVALRKGRAAARRLSAESATPAEGSPSSDQQRAFLIKLEQEFEGLKGGRAHKGTPETAASRTNLGVSPASASDHGDPELKAALDRADADLRAIKALLAEVSLERDDMRRQLNDALRERDDWRVQAEEWKAQAERLSLTLPAPRSPPERLVLTLPTPRPALPKTTLAPPPRRSWWPWRRRAE